MKIREKDRGKKKREIERKKKRDNGEEIFYILEGKKKSTSIYSVSSTLCFACSLNQQ